MALKQNETISYINCTGSWTYMHRCVQAAKVCQLLKKRFFESQIRAASSSKFGIRWPEHDKLLALGLCYKSPAAYQYMKHIFGLPSNSTLHSYMSQFKVLHGFNCDYLKALEKRATLFNDKERCVVVTFDAMSVKSRLKYLDDKDKIVGLVDCA